MLDPIVALTVAATVTDRIGLGTDVLVAPWYPPVLLARTLAGLDQVSRGRLVAGFGLGWSVDEFDAVGAPMAGRGQRLEEILDVMGAVWSDPIVDIATSHERIAPSAMGLKPAQPSGPPILLAATSAAGLDRIADRADGWLPFGVPARRSPARAARSSTTSTGSATSAPAISSLDLHETARNVDELLDTVLALSTPRLAAAA